MKVEIEVKLPCHVELPEKVQRAARDRLRELVDQHRDYRESDLGADCIVEQLWNVLTGLSDRGPQ